MSCRIVTTQKPQCPNHHDTTMITFDTTWHRVISKSQCTVMCWEFLLVQFNTDLFLFNCWIVDHYFFINVSSQYYCNNNNVLPQAPVKHNKCLVRVKGQTIKYFAGLSCSLASVHHFDKPDTSQQDWSKICLAGHILTGQKRAMTEIKFVWLT